MPTQSNPSRSNGLRALHRQIHTLKRLSRRGWVLRDIPHTESVADHAFAVALLTLVVANERGLDVGRAVAAALVHELGEAIVGDIVPADGIDPHVKRTREEDAVRAVLAAVDDSGYLVELWRDFEYQRTPEGRLVKQLDRLEMALQASVYEGETGRDLSEFWESAARAIDDPQLMEVLDELRDGRR